MRSRMYILSLMCLIVLTANAVRAEVPAMMNYQGYLADAVGTPLNETVDMEFSLYQEEAGGTPLWTEIQGGIVVSEGIFNVILGSSAPLDLPFDVPYYLGIRINGEEMAPRKPLLSVPYALNAKPTAPAVTAPGSYMPGLVSISPYEDCTLLGPDEINDMECVKRTLLTVAVAKETYVRLEGTLQREVENNGDDGSTYMEEIAAAITLTRQGDTIACTIEYNTAAHTFTLSPAAPLYGGHDAPPVDFTARLLADGLVALTVYEMSDTAPLLRQVIAESAAHFTISVSSAGTQHVQLTVEVANHGNLPSVYLVTVPACDACDDLVPAQSTTVDPQATDTFTFDLYSADGFMTGDTCVLELRSPSGRLYDTKTITLQ